MLQVRVSPTARKAFRTIAAAVKEVGGRPTRVLLDGGEYPETLALTGELQLRRADGAGPVRVVSTGGTTLTTAGQVELTGIEVVNHKGLAVRVSSGSLVLDGCEVRGTGDLNSCLSADPGSTLTARRSTFRSGQVLLTRARGSITDCALTSSRGHGVWARDGGSLRITGCTITDASQSAVYGKGTETHVERCDVRAAGSTAIVITDDVAGSVLDCVVHDMNKTAVGAVRNARVTVERLTVNLARSGIEAWDEGSVTASGCRIVRCSYAGLVADSRSKVRAEDCTIDDCGRYGIYVRQGGTMTARAVTITDAEIGARVAAGRGEFTDLTITRADTGVQAALDCTVRITGGRISDGGTGVESTESKTGVPIVELAELTVARMRRSGLRVDQESRFTATRLTVSDTRGPAITVGDAARLKVTGGTVSGSGAEGVAVSDTGALDATDLTVQDNAGIGITATEQTKVALQDCTLTGNTAGDLSLAPGCDQYLVSSTVRRTVQQTEAEPVSAGAGPATAVTPVTTLPAAGDPMAELAGLIGLEPVKQQVRTQVNMIRLGQQRVAAGLPVPPLSRHLVFSGPPGTGKTTVARLYGQILASLGVLTNGAVHEVTRSQLVGQYLGATAIRTREQFTEAHGGVLFIDEAYTLARQFGANADFGQEAIDELVALMENERDKVVVIAAGYTDEMEEFLGANPGLRSRFSRTIEFPPYSTDELVQITKLIAGNNHYELGADVLDALRAHFDRHAAAGTPINARDARNLFESMVESQAERLAGVDAPAIEQLTLLTVQDLPG